MFPNFRSYYATGKNLSNKFFLTAQAYQPGRLAEKLVCWLIDEAEAKAETTTATATKGGASRSSELRGGAGDGLIRKARRTLAPVVTAMLIFVCYTAPAFAQTAPGADKLKQLGTKFSDVLRSYGLILCGIGVTVAILLGAILILGSAFLGDELKTRGTKMMRVTIIATMIFACATLIIPILLDLINSLGGDKIEGPATGAK